MHSRHGPCLPIDLISGRVFGCRSVHVHVHVHRRRRIRRRQGGRRPDVDFDFVDFFVCVCSCVVFLRRERNLGVRSQCTATNNHSRIDRLGCTNFRR